MERKLSYAENEEDKSMNTEMQGEGMNMWGIRPRKCYLE